MTVLATYPATPAVEAAPGGLLSVATVSDQFGWLDGNDLFDSYNCMTFGAEAAFCDDNDKDFDNSIGWQDGARFAVYGGVKCKAIGLDQPKMLAETQRVFSAGESTGVERGLMKYRFAESADHWDEPETVTTEAECPAVAVALLEAYAGAHYVGVPTLHLGRAVASLMMVNGAIAREGDGYRTQLGSKVVIGSGYDYPSLGPDGEEAAAGTRWIYMTGEVVVIRGPLVVRQAMDHSTNEVLVLAERPYIVAVDCFTAAALVNLEC